MLRVVLLVQLGGLLVLQVGVVEAAAWSPFLLWDGNREEQKVLSAGPPGVHNEVYSSSLMGGPPDPGRRARRGSREPPGCLTAFTPRRKLMLMLMLQVTVQFKCMLDGTSRDKPELAFPANTNMSSENK